ncbi:SNF2 domain-containing protein CLASSY 3 [Brachypodium distachyon]|nr:SNF2 domain-containing protein CLASSY 3 [Brachypodium distachyon]|eukprot:XP_024315038.1 SNF2 domain-containing protein CLASSY 3 [Brachypodium distachyon]
MLSDDESTAAAPPGTATGVPDEEEEAELEDKDNLEEEQEEDEEDEWEEEEEEEREADLEDMVGEEEEEEQGKEEDEWELEEEEEEEHEETEEEESESEQDEEAAEEPRRGGPRNSAAAGRYAHRAEDGEIFAKRLFEGLCISKAADTSAAGKPVAGRTRSRRRCLNTKLLRQGTYNKPYCLDTPSESGSSEAEEGVNKTPPAPALSSSDEEIEADAGGHGRTAARKGRRRGKNPTPSDDDSEEHRVGGRQGTAVRRRRWPKDNTAQCDHEEEEDDEAFVPFRRPKRSGAVPNPRDGYYDQQQQAGDAPFKKSSLILPKKRCGAGQERETYDDLLQSIFDEITNQQNGSAPLDDGSAPAQEQSVPDTLPLIFSFGDEDQVVKEKTEQGKFEDLLWAEFDFALESTNACSHACQEEGEKSNGDEIHADRATSCKRGKHDLIMDEQIGIRCKHCDFIDLEIRDVFPSMVKFSIEREPAMSLNLDLFCEDIIKSMGYEGTSHFDIHESGLVWDLIPGVREHMFPHQREGFEFMWKKLAGGIDIQQVKHTVNTDSTSGCVISHAPGTGKTRLAITFVQSYLELFPWCRPVIIAPRGMLATWEQEFKKWNVKLPFHLLSSSGIHWDEDKTIKKLVAQDESLGQKLSMNKLSQKSRLMLKLASWYEGSCIIGLSYSLYRNLAKGEDMDGETVRNLLLKNPGLLVLDEGHTPRNKKSLIWKVLAEVSTEKRIILSGTPFQNNFLELYNILCLVKPKFARDFACTRLNKKDFSSKRTCQSRATHHLEEDEGKEFWKSLRMSNITDDHLSEIREKLDPFVHIHNGDILQKSLPGLKESVVILNPLPHQKEIITMMEKSAGKGFLDAEYKISLASIHPFLLTSVKLSDEEASIVNKLKSSRLDPCEGVKTRFVLEIVRLCKPLKERVLVFSQYLEPLSLIMDQLTKKFNWTEGKEILLMSGNVRVKQREALMEAFNDMNSEARVMLASTKACCEGITLVGSSRVVLLDVVWNPSVGRQAIGRAYRIGQEKIVYTYNLIAEGTKEKIKYDRQAKKDHMSKLLFTKEPQAAGCNLTPELIFDDRILEAMTAHEELKDMFVQILPSH